MDIYQQLSKKFAIIMPHLNEKQRRLLLAAEAKMIGWGGVSKVAKASGISRVTVVRPDKAGAFSGS
jgi:DNA-binding phage protein